MRQLIFRVFEISVEEPYFRRGSRLLFPINLTVTVLALGALLFVQFSSAPNLVRSSLAQRAAYEMQQAVNSTGLASTVESNARFTRARIGDQDTLLGIPYAQRSPNVVGTNEVLEQQLEGQVEQHLQTEFADFTPLVNVELLEPPR